MSEDKKAMEHFKERLTGDVSEMVNTNLGKPRKLSKEEQKQDDEFVKELFRRRAMLESEKKNNL